MPDLFQFERVFGSLDPFPYDRAFIQKVDSRRRLLEGSLFIDRVLKALNLAKATSNYPPKNEAVLRQLHDQICESKLIAYHHKLSIIYYLLLDIDELVPKSNTLRNLDSKADSFASRAGIPPKYQTMMRGLWYMDAKEFEVALQYLTHPSLQPDFVDDIITILVRNAVNGDFTLPLAYYHTVQPIVQSSPALELLFDALARTNVVEAFRFSRSHADFMRRQLFQKLVLSVLASPRNDESAERAFELSSLPLDAQEERWLEECLQSGEGKRLAVAKDTLIMRRIATGKGGLGGEKGTWGVVLEGFKTGSGGRPQA
ncbi:nuclear pore complex assembly-domain-containing protein [Xylariaceae sp. FL0662B]|nr:nuclear pore complex assembly-domain-containing protein [Xylariaceae sp. FL0662B]